MILARKLRAGRAIFFWCFLIRHVVGMFAVSRRVGWSGEAESLQSRREVNTRTHATKRERERDRRFALRRFVPTLRVDYSETLMLQ